ncbi:Sporulation domain protein [Rhodothermus marinus DSM 4252]|uniref:Sporulation domain protein n=1 Tax=Rhodothermus marinus (strain ATCC 43812 / DSM 4252 / R-10) TaxID=518766 RepID=D0MJV9_RHOM4|nr:Sporulation domain protein [Rhodothermus marinus DSM 4252]
MVNRPVLFGLVFLLAGCAATRGAQEQQGPAPEEAPIDWSAYEDFDPTRYPDPPPPPLTVQHDVPEALMEGKAGASAARTVEGYRVQIFLTENKATADSIYTAAVAWWRRMAAQGLLEGIPGAQDDPPPVYIVYRAPYYRIRLGNFRTREEAERLRELAARRFEGAFVTSDRVTLGQ